MNFLNNWKTTLAGVASVLTGAGDGLGQILAGNFNFSSGSLSKDVGLLVVGLGLIFAKDHNSK